MSKQSEGLRRVDPQSNSGAATKQKSWVQVAQKHVFTKQKFVVSEVDGKEKVVVPKEGFVGAKPLWEDFLIGKFLNTKAPHVGKIHMIVNKIWRLGDRSALIDVYEVNATTVKFRIRTETMRDRVLNRGMWNIMDIPMIVSKWTPYAEELQPALKSIPLWITLKNVPPTMFTDKGLEFLASAVGEPKRLHPKTEACVSFDEAQILVEADLTKDLPKEYIFTGEEEGELDVVVHYAYPWLPPRCSCCKKWGHLRDSCLSDKKDEVAMNLGPEEAHVSATEKDDQTAPIPTAGNGNTEVVTTVGVVGDSNDVREESNPPEHEKDQGWITPVRPGRSPTKKAGDLKFGEVSILKNSYSVLSGEGGLEEESQITTVGEAAVINVSKTDTQTVEVKENHGDGSKTSKVEPQLRPSLPRGSKTAHKVIPNPSTQSTRNLPKDQSKKHLSKHH